MELLPRCALALCEALKGDCNGLSIVDSTPIAVCDNLRINQHKVFNGMAQRSKSSTGWFFGFKLHVVINHLGELRNIRLTPSNVDDRKPVPDLIQGIFGKLYGDKGYLSKPLGQTLKEKGVELITRQRRNMKSVPHSDFDKAVLRHRSVIETVFDELKNLCQIKHSRHRSPFNFIVNLLAGVVAYCFMPSKPKMPLAYTNNLNQTSQILIPN